MAVYVDGQLLSRWEGRRPHATLEKIHLEAGKPYPLKVEYRQKRGRGGIGIDLAAAPPLPL